ncbi:MAG: ABA4-like family protein [Trueperaceae bacterium]
MNTIFSLSSLLVMPFWFLMIFLPTWKWTKRVIVSPWIVVGAAALYAALVLPGVLQILPAVMNPSLQGIQTLLGTPSGATIAWVHFLAFDLFVGRWVYLDSREKKVTPLIVSPILFFVFMLGPLGFLLYLFARLFTQRGSETTFAQA